MRGTTAKIRLGGPYKGLGLLVTTLHTRDGQLGRGVRKIISDPHPLRSL